jgi:hypothetical protein
METPVSDSVQALLDQLRLGIQTSSAVRTARKRDPPAAQGRP